MVAYDCPYKIEVNAEVLMDNDIAKGDDLVPRDFGVCLAEFGR